MSPKKAVTKTAAPAAEEPAAKKAKGEEEAKKEEAPKEEAVEKEGDAKDDKRSKIEALIAFQAADSTLNVVPTLGGKILTCLQEGGIQYFLAGARASVGMKAGRYLYEVKVLEMLNPAEPYSKVRPPQPRQVVRLGFSTAGSSPLMGDNDAEAVFFDAEGTFTSASGKKFRTGKRFGREEVMAVLLNLDAESPNANTVSLFCNGIRASEPQPLPESLHGKALFPHVTFRNVSLQVNFGPEPLKALPFKCRALQGAADKDCQVTKVADGKCEVLFPVAIPDEGTFEWLDGFLEKNPQYVEISDRMLGEWATKSGFWKPKGKDDLSVQKVVTTMASIVPRNYVVMEVKQNLVPEERIALAKRFPKSLFKRVARVVMGEPPADFKAKVKSKLLKQKGIQAEVEYRAKKADKERKKLADKKTKEIEEKKAAFEVAKKKAEDAKKAADGGEAAEKKEEAKDDAPKEKPKEEPEEEPKEDEKEEEDAGPEKVSLTDEDEKLWFLTPSYPDVAMNVLDMSFAKFTIPEKAEGFDDITFEWGTVAKSKDHLQKWMLEKKRTCRIEDLQPGEWFKTASTEWAAKVEEWQAKQVEAKGKAQPKKEGDEEEEVLVDVFACSDVSDTGKGEPLYMKFAPEDWALMGLRWELATLARAFKQDVNDEERATIPEPHLAFYYTRYFKKQFLPKNFGKDTLSELCTIVKDTAKVDEKSMLVIQLAGDAEADSFVRLTEESRRERQRRIDAGDETVRLKLNMAMLSSAPTAGKPAVGKGGAKKEWQPAPKKT